MTKTEVVKDHYGVAIRHDNPVELIKEVPVKVIDTIEKPMVMG